MKDNHIDAVTFSMIRLAGGAATLWLITTLRDKTLSNSGNWTTAIPLFIYVVGFSLAYKDISAATGALILFASVQITMLGYALYQGERLIGKQWFGLGLAILGNVILLLPGANQPSLAGSALMLFAGVAWGIYSILGRMSDHPLGTNAGSFIRATILALLLFSLTKSYYTDTTGLWLALISGVVTSGAAYCIWYYVLPRIKTTVASISQLSVPILTEIGSYFILDEALTGQFLLVTILVISGVMLITLTSERH